MRYIYKDSTGCEWTISQLCQEFERRHGETVSAQSMANRCVPFRSFDIELAMRPKLHDGNHRRSTLMPSGNRVSLPKGLT